MNFGIIGFGRIARKFVQSIEHVNGAKVVAIGSKSVSKEDEYLLKYPDIQVYHDYLSLLEDKNVDAVYIALPHKFHYTWVIEALKHHKVVLCEKPAVLTVEEMEEIKRVALEEKTYFLEALKTKLNVGRDHLKEDLASIGSIQKIEANFCFDAISQKGTGAFLFDPQQGGALNDVGPYLVGFVLDMIDSPITKIESNKKVVDEIEEHFENGAIANIEGAIDENKERYAKIIGEKGVIEIPMFNRIIDYTIQYQDHTTLTRHYPIVGDDMTKEIQAVVDDVKEGKIQNDQHSLDDSIAVIEVINAIRNQ